MMTRWFLHCATGLVWWWVSLRCARSWRGRCDRKEGQGSALDPLGPGAPDPDSFFVGCWRSWFVGFAGDLSL
jgi:hypothetical protein